ncbi:Uma2 family endonuclease [Nocardia alni]|uniref:Uma2 family endonuclease n=1 Tax=Nocardia alni TaxID=2815723 RepID=UPI001C23BAC2|nr:Uma2 family endonuclease [Nocardia alni]
MVTELVDGIRAISRGWTSAQVGEVEVPYDWELIEGRLIVRGRIDQWHRSIRKSIAASLGQPLRAPYAVVTDRCLYLDELDVVRPDIAVIDEAEANLYGTQCLSASAAALVVEIVSAATLSDDWFRKPRLYAAAGISNYWRVERGHDERPIVYQYWLDHESGEYVPAPTFVHTETLATTVPYRIRIDLSAARARACAPSDSAARRTHGPSDGLRAMRSRRRCPQCYG